MKAPASTAKQESLAPLLRALRSVWALFDHCRTLQQPSRQGLEICCRPAANLMSLCKVTATPYTGEAVARGVVAAKPMSRGQHVETAHCIAVPEDQYTKHLRHTTLEHYVFKVRSGGVLVALGLGSLFNHSRTPNLDFRVDADHLVIHYYAARDIAENEELFIYYGSNLWFEDNQETRTMPTHNHEHMEDEQAFLEAMQL